MKIFHHHHHVPEGLGMFPFSWSSRCSWSLHLFLGRPMFLRPFGLDCSACFGSLSVSILCTCCSHFSWYSLISFTMFCAPVFLPNTLILFSFFNRFKPYNKTILRYGLDGPGIECRWWWDFPQLSRPALGLNHPPTHWVPCLFSGSKVAGAWRWPPTPNLAPRLKKE